MEYKKPSAFFYKITQLASNVVARFFFKRKYSRNEIKGKKGPFVVIANHQATLDFANLIGANRARMSFVISNSFYNSLSVKWIMDKIAVIPKQQFQTTLKDLGKMKAVIENGAPLVIYPAGLMSEDGLSTPIPSSTYKFLKWLGADIYAARTSGSYFCTPKWSNVKRPGRTYMDIYKLFSKEELAEADEEFIKEKCENAILFDAYREQEKLRVKYKHGDNVEGLENVLYKCPHCLSEFSIRSDKNRLFCKCCGYEQLSDKYGFLHNEKGIGEEIRYVSDWSKFIQDGMREKVVVDDSFAISEKAVISTIDFKKKKFVESGKGTVTLADGHITINALINGEQRDIAVPVSNFASLPFSPGKHFEIQHGEEIFRCAFENGQAIMKFIHAVEILYELNVHNHENHSFH